jgi:hypothetical protein
MTPYRCTHYSDQSSRTELFIRFSIIFFSSLSSWIPPQSRLNNPCWHNNTCFNCLFGKCDVHGGCTFAYVGVCHLNIPPNLSLSLCPNNPEGRTGGREEVIRLLEMCWISCEREHKLLTNLYRDRVNPPGWSRWH